MTPKIEEASIKQEKYFFCSRCGETGIDRSVENRKLNKKQKISRKRNGSGQFGKSDFNTAKQDFKEEHSICHKKCINCSELFCDIKDRVQSNNIFNMRVIPGNRVSVVIGNPW